MQTLRHNILLAVIWGATALVVLAAGLWLGGRWYDEWSGFNASWSVSDGSCSIAVIPIHGTIISYEGANRDGLTSSADLPPATDPDTIYSMMRAAEADPNIHGILIQIDSYGGAPVASMSIAERIKHSSLPTIALIGDAGLSGGYLAATGANTIIASPLSDVGSIGITMSYLENSKKNTTDGLSYVSLSSGQYKDAGDPNKPLTAGERALFERDLNIGHQQFVQKIAANRKLPQEDVAKLADGSSMIGTLALEHGLVDQLGDLETARVWFAKELGMSADEVFFCP